MNKKTVCIMLLTAAAGFILSYAILPDVVHWHGAAPKSRFVHIGLSTKVHLGPAAWFGPVTDEEYSEATQ